MDKLKVGLVFGGRSAEHEISLRSAQNVINAIDKERYDLIYIAIDKEGNWYTNTSMTGKIPEFPLSISQFHESISIDMGKGRGLYIPEKNTRLSDITWPIWRRWYNTGFVQMS